MSLSDVVRTGVAVVEIYGLLGVLFATWFAWSGVARLDPHARDAGWGFRLVIVPGATIFWPLLLWRLAIGVTMPPLERNAHRRLARERAR